MLQQSLVTLSSVAAMTRQEDSIDSSDYFSSATMNGLVDNGKPISLDPIVHKTMFETRSKAPLRRNIQGSVGTKPIIIKSGHDNLLNLEDI